jgi:hypothetical protein
MSTTTTFDINKPIPHLSRPHELLDPNKPPLHLETLTLSWGVWDLDADAATTFEADGGHFQSLPGHRYIIIVRAADVQGIKRITLDGSGMFQSSPIPDKAGSFQAPFLLPASIQHAEHVSAGTTEKFNNLVVIMKPDIGAFVYSRLSCGFHHFGNTPASLEYFADNGLMKFSATAINGRGDIRTATLTTAP